MNRRKAPLLLAAALLVAASVLFFWRMRPEPLEASTGPSPQATAASSPASAARARPAASTAAADEEGEDAAQQPEEDLATWLRSRYGPTIHQPHTQMRMLEKLMRHFQRLNPTGWEADVLATLRQAFPELYEELALRLRQRVEYEKWTKANHEQLKDKSPEERRAAVLEERHKLFGKEIADQIWAAELRNVAVADALKAIDALPQASVGERLTQYKQSLKQTYGENTDAYIQAHQQELTNRFLNLDSVQQELGALAPDQRSAQLQSLRKEMGLDEEALARWKDLDSMRDARWELGAQYMIERQQLAQQYSGGELEARVAQLRGRYFTDEAQTIAEEEASGFFRFTQPRQWGRN